MTRNAQVLWRLAIVAWLSVCGWAADVPQKAAVIQSDVDMQLPAGKYPRPVKCDSQGFLYMLGPEPNSGEATGLAGIQVSRLDATGQLVATFPPQLPSGIEGPARYVDFAADGSGGLIGLINSLVETGNGPKKRSGPYLAKYNSDGSLNGVSAMEVGERLVPARLDVLVTGQLLVSGTDRISHVPVSVVFDSNGRNPMKVEGTARLEKTMSGDEITALRESLRQASIAVGTDGDTYFVSRSTRPMVLVISSSGQLTRYFVVRPPVPELTAVGAQQNGSTLAIAFAPKNSEAATVVRMVDTTTRQPQADYALGDSAKGQLVCYAADGSFSLLVTLGQGEKFKLKTIKP